MVEREIICITCPSSCHIKVKAEGENIISIEGNACKNGLTYATAEYLHPERMLTSIIKANGYTAPVISVRSSKPIPKDKQLECISVIRTLEAEAPFYIGKVVLENILGTGADIILTNE